MSKIYVDAIEHNNKIYMSVTQFKFVAPTKYNNAKTPEKFLQDNNIKHIIARKNKKGIWKIIDKKENGQTDKYFIKQRIFEKYDEKVVEYELKLTKDDGNDDIKEKRKYIKTTASVVVKPLEINSTKPMLSNTIEYEKIPKLIELQDEQKIKDADNNILDIRTYGEIKDDKIFFNIHDVSDCFDMKSLYKNIDRVNCDKYSEHIHYKIFECNKTDDVYPKNNILHTFDESSIEIKNTAININKYNPHRKFLTFEGMLYVLFSSRSPHARKFVKWAVNVLFTVQYGNDESKNKLISKIKGGIL